MKLAHWIHTLITPLFEIVSYRTLLVSLFIKTFSISGSWLWQRNWRNGSSIRNCKKGISRCTKHGLIGHFLVSLATWWKPKSKSFKQNLSKCRQQNTDVSFVIGWKDSCEKLFVWIFIVFVCEVASSYLWIQTFKAARWKLTTVSSLDSNNLR